MYFKTISGSSSISRYLASIDSIYASCFTGDAWRDMTERGDSHDVSEAISRIGLYLHNGTATMLLPVAEAMLTYKEKR